MVLSGFFSITILNKNIFCKIGILKEKRLSGFDFFASELFTEIYAQNFVSCFIFDLMVNFILDLMVTSFVQSMKSM